MRVLLVTSWGNACGIADHSAMLKRSVEAADATMRVTPSSEALDPVVGLSYLSAQYMDQPDGKGFDLLHLNHHDALHARWTPEIVERLTRRGLPVLVTYHDTTADPSPTSKLAQLAQVASSVVVHEPLHPDSTIKAIYWRQGIPAPALAPVQYHVPGDAREMALWGVVAGGDPAVCFKAFPQQPVLGTFGFHFPWKQYDDLARITGEKGWALVILSNNATEEDEMRWRALNSSILVIRKFLSQEVAINYLAGCDVTAFMYSCANTGTSAAIRYGIAARKPVIALKGCRQFRDLQLLDNSKHRVAVGPSGVAWVDDWQDFRRTLQNVQPHPWQSEVATRAHEDSWMKAGQDYATLYRMLVEGTR